MEVHRDEGVQGRVGEGVPPGQKNPAGHAAAKLVVDPAGQPYPGEALQFPEHAGTDSPVVEPNVPLGHKSEKVDPLGQ